MSTAYTEEYLQKQETKINPEGIKAINTLIRAIKTGRALSVIDFKAINTITTEIISKMESVEHLNFLEDFYKQALFNSIDLKDEYKALIVSNKITENINYELNALYKKTRYLCEE